MKNLIIYIIATLIFCGLLTVDGGQLHAQVKFQKHYNSGSNPEYFISMHPISTGGYLAVGISNNITGSTEEFIIVEMDMFGNKVNQKGFGGSNKNFGFYFVAETDTSYVLAGGSNANSGNSEDIVLTSIKKDFSQTYWTRWVGGSSREFTRLVEKGSNGYYGTGWGNSMGNGWQHYTYKINNDGSFGWSKSWGGAGTEKTEALALTKDGGFIVAGEQSSNAISGADAIVYKFNASGDTLQWGKTYSATTGDHATGIKQTKDGNYIVTGQSYRASGPGGGWLYDLFMMKLDTAGTILWSYVYGDTILHYSWWMGSHIIELEDSSIVIGGTRRTTSNGFDAYLIKTNKNGDLQWSRRYGSSSTETIYDIAAAPDGGFLLTGQTNGFGAGSNYNCYVIKTDANGLSGCNEDTTLISRRSHSFSSASRSYTINNHTNTTTGGSLKTASVTANTQCIANDGSSCANAYLLTEADYNNTVFTMTDTVMWFRYNEVEKFINTYLGYTGDTSLFSVEEIRYYKGNCSDLIFVDSATKHPATYYAIGKTHIITLPDTYYIKIRKNNLTNAKFVINRFVNESTEKRELNIPVDPNGEDDWKNFVIGSLETCGDRDTTTNNPHLPEYTYYNNSKLKVNIICGNEVCIWKNYPTGLTNFIIEKITFTDTILNYTMDGTDTIYNFSSAQIRDTVNSFFHNFITKDCYCFNLPQGTYNMTAASASIDAITGDTITGEWFVENSMFFVWEEERPYFNLSSDTISVCYNDTLYIPLAVNPFYKNMFHWYGKSFAKHFPSIKEHFGGDILNGIFTNSSSRYILEDTLIYLSTSKNLISSMILEQAGPCNENRIYNDPESNSDIIYIRNIAPESHFGHEISCNISNNFSVSFSDSSMCAKTWYWEFGDDNTSTQQNPTHVYTEPGTYQVTLTVNNGLVSEADTTITIMLAYPETPVITGNLTACDLTTRYTVTNHLNPQTYYWKVNGGLASFTLNNYKDITWPNSDGGTVEALAILPNGCRSEYGILQVNACCFGSDTNAIVFADTTISAFKDIFNGGVTNFSSSSEIVFNGVITVDEDISFINCPNLKMAPNARFEILDGNTLTIDFSNISASDSCLAMWDGIYINEGALLRVIKESEISNAKNAIVSVNGGNYFLNESTLKENYIHLWVKRYDDDHDGEISEMTFSCANTLIYPHTGELTNVAIKIDSVYSVEIGNISAEPNLIRDAIVGISADNSNVVIENNNFGYFFVGSNLQVGVYGINNNDQFTNGITIRNNGFFEVAQYGIYIQNCHRTDINYNYINTNEGSFGTLISDAKSIYTPLFSTTSITKINDNVITGSNFACALINANNATEIKRNNITLSTSGTYFRAGIIAISTFAPAAPASPLAALIPKLEVEEDTITNANLGMLVWNRPKNLIRKNIIELTDNGSTFLNRGIESWNNWGATVNCNNITGDNNTDENTQLGIEGFLTSGTTFHCNTIAETGRAINIMGQSQWSTLLQNQLNDVLIGIGIDREGAIGQQGWQGTNTITFDNQWDVTNAPDAHLRAYRGSDGEQSKFFLRGPQGAANPWFPNGFVSDIDVLPSQPSPFQTATPTSPLVSCAVETCGPIEAPLFNADEARLTILDSIAYPSDSLTHRWWARNNLYIALLAQDSLVNNDSLIGAFFDEYSQSNIVMLDSLKWAVHLFTMTDFEGDKEAEEAAYNYLLNGIDNITADNQMEFNLQTYAKRRLQLTLSPENEDLMNAIEDVANQCVFYGGPTVLEARGFWKLNSGFFDIFEEDLEADCNMPLYRRAIFEEEKTKTLTTIAANELSYKIQPNLQHGDKQGYVLLGEQESGTAVLYDITGKQLATYMLKEGSNQLDFSKLEISGMVIYEIRIDEVIKTRDKLLFVSR